MAKTKKSSAKTVKTKTMPQASSPLFTISCKTMGGDCGFSVTTHSQDEAKKAIWAHARYAHSDKMNGMSEEQKQAMAEMINGLLAKK